MFDGSSIAVCAKHSPARMHAGMAMYVLHVLQLDSMLGMVLGTGATP